MRKRWIWVGALTLTMLAGQVMAVTCLEAGEIVEGLAIARDKGKSRAEVGRIIRAEDTYSAKEKFQLQAYADIVYENRDLPGKALSNLAIDFCYKTAKKL